MEIPEKTPLFWEFFWPHCWTTFWPHCWTTFWPHWCLTGPSLVPYWALTGVLTGPSGILTGPSGILTGPYGFYVLIHFVLLHWVLSPEGTFVILVNLVNLSENQKCHLLDIRNATFWTSEMPLFDILVSDPRIEQGDGWRMAKCGKTAKTVVFLLKQCFLLKLPIKRPSIWQFCQFCPHCDTTGRLVDKYAKCSKKPYPILEALAEMAQKCHKFNVFDHFLRYQICRWHFGEKWEIPLFSWKFSKIQ